MSDSESGFLNFPSRLQWKVICCETFGENKNYSSLKIDSDVGGEANVGSKACLYVFGVSEGTYSKWN